MSAVQLVDVAGRRRSPATMPGFRAGRPPRSLLCQWARRPVGGFAGVLAGGDSLAQARCRPAEAMGLFMDCSGLQSERSSGRAGGCRRGG
jgi:hypothetical protein